MQYQWQDKKVIAWPRRDAYKVPKRQLARMIGGRQLSDLGFGVIVMLLRRTQGDVEDVNCMTLLIQRTHSNRGQIVHVNWYRTGCCTRTDA